MPEIKAITTWDLQKEQLRIERAAHAGRVTLIVEINEDGCEFFDQTERILAHPDPDNRDKVTMEPKLWRENVPAKLLAGWHLEGDSDADTALVKKFEEQGFKAVRTTRRSLIDDLREDFKDPNRTETQLLKTFSEEEVLLYCRRRTEPMDWEKPETSEDEGNDENNDVNKPPHIPSDSPSKRKLPPPTDETPTSYNQPYKYARPAAIPLSPHLRKLRPLPKRSTAYNEHTSLATVLKWIFTTGFYVDPASGIGKYTPVMQCKRRRHFDVEIAQVADVEEERERKKRRVEVEVEVEVEDVVMMGV